MAIITIYIKKMGVSLEKTFIFVFYVYNLRR